MSPETPLVSVILPVRNGGDWLPAAVESILSQTEANLELLLVDDHSTDGSVQSLSFDDARLRRLASLGEGVVAAFNTGLARARGAFIARMDADDIALERRLEWQLNYLRSHQHVSLAGGCVEIFGAQAIGAGNRRYQSWLNGLRDPEAIHEQIFVESPIPNPTLLARREAMVALGGYRDCAWPEDYDFFLRADDYGLKMGKPEQILLRWREHQGRLTRTDPRYDIERFQAAKAYFLAHSRLQGRPVVVWGAGPTGRALFDFLHEQGVEIRGFLEIHPRRVGGQKRGLPVWHFEHAAKIRNEIILVAVGAAGARETIRDYFEGIGRVEGYDYLFVA
jgi:glycosyltransferase involved in cell wall biosynthesis